MRHFYFKYFEEKTGGILAVANWPLNYRPKKFNSKILHSFSLIYCNMNCFTVKCTAILQLSKTPTIDQLF